MAMPRQKMAMPRQNMAMPRQNMAMPRQKIWQRHFKSVSATDDDLNIKTQKQLSFFDFFDSFCKLWNDLIQIAYDTVISYIKDRC